MRGIRVSKGRATRLGLGLAIAGVLLLATGQTASAASLAAIGGVGSATHVGPAAKVPVPTAPVPPSTSSKPANSRTAWWNMTPASAVPGVGSTSPLTPNGGIQVTTNGTTTTAFGAITYKVPLNQGGQKVDPTSLQAILTLSYANQSAGTPTLEACPTTSSWKPGGGQPASAAPKYSCSGGSGAQGIVNSSSSTVTWNLSSLQESVSTPGVFSVAIVPASNLTPAQSFSTEFNPPDPSSFRVLSWTPTTGGAGLGSSSSSSSSFPTGTGSSSAPPVASGAGSSSPAVGASNPSSSFSGSSGGGGAVSSPASAAPASAGSGSSASSPAGSSGSPVGSALGSTTPAAATTTSAGTRKDLLLGLLLGLALLALVVAGQKSRVPRLLVPLPGKSGPTEPVKN